MAWTNKPKVRDLEPYAKKYGFKAVVVIGFYGRRKYNIRSYGINRELCKAVKKVNDEIFRLLDSGQEIIPAELY